MKGDFQMKKLLLLAMTMLMAVMLVAGCGSDGPKKMVVGLDDNFAPMGFRNEKNEIVGYDIPERAEVYQLSKPYMKNAQLIVVPANSSINKIADLAGKVVAVQDDSTGSYIIDGNDEMRNSLKEYRKYPDFAAVYMDIDSGRVEAAVVDAVLARYYDSKNPGKYRILEENLGDEVVAVAFRKDDKDYAPLIDKALDEMKKDGTAKKISEQWFNADLTNY